MSRHRRWPNAEAMVAAAVDAVREITQASVVSAAPGERRPPDPQRDADPRRPLDPQRRGDPQRPAGAGRPPDPQRPADAQPPWPAARGSGGPRRPERPAKHAAAGAVVRAPVSDSPRYSASAPPAAAGSVVRVASTAEGERPDQRKPVRSAPAVPARPHTATPRRRTPPDRTLAIVRARSGRLRRAAWRVGGPQWGVRLTMSVIIAVMLLTVTGFAFERLTGADVLPDGAAARFWPAPRDFPVLGRSVPVSIRASAVRIDAPVHGVGDAAGGAIDVPRGERFDEAGWYDRGPTPGEYGPAVIVGHVDNGDGPSVFHKLSRLRPGNRVEVTRADGSVAVFQVNAVRRYDREDLPAEEVFGDFSRPGLRLITCGGRWVGGTTGYADNVVVFAALVEARPGGG